MPLVPFDALVTGARSGNLVSFPTDTVPALAAIPDSASLIFKAKQRSLNKPLILMAANASELWNYVIAKEHERKVWQEVVQKYWPGALTLVLPASKQVPTCLNPSDPSTIGIRVPDCEIACKILAQTGPLATTSANISGQPALRSMTEIAATFPDVLTLLPEGLPTESSISDIKPSDVKPSTVAKWSNNGWEILRQGSVILKL